MPLLFDVGFSVMAHKARRALILCSVWNELSTFSLPGFVDRVNSKKNGTLPVRPLGEGC